MSQNLMPQTAAPSTMVPSPLIKPEDIAVIQKEAENTVQKLSTADSQGIEKIVDQLGSLGENTQMIASQSLEVLRQPVKNMMVGGNNAVSNTLLDLRSNVDELNPNNIFKKGGLSTVFAKMFGKNPMTTYIRKYESVQTQIDNIVAALYNGRDKLQADTVSLKQLKINAQDKIYELEKRVYLGNKLVEMLEAETAKPERTNEKHLIEKGTVKVVGRVKNMMQMVNILQQSIASVDIIAENNEKLDEAVLNAITMTQNIVTVSAAIQMALQNQQQVIKATQATNQAIGSMITENAKLLRQNTEETNKMLEQPAIQIETLRAAFNDTYAALQNTEQSNRRIIDSSKTFIGELDKFNTEMKQKLGMPGGAAAALTTAQAQKPQAASLLD